ncbi:hypothetical protein [Thalassotalea sp. PS06]|uniref:hypothetical protein n=1 Tax=Thalassotalea sp. PS06 TaxID=2594005 RepID=UPI001161CEBC|nr:hypothetical protein [Thalassotalea sp. PS06]QDP02077.1 hypothetical protein FNC98_12445 [Thalassotalea sp. PS06]
MKLSIITSSISLILLSFPSYAYLDPGTGSIIIQGIIASIALGLATMKMWWHRFTGFFRKSESEDDNELVNSKQDSNDSTKS